VIEEGTVSEDNGNAATGVLLGIVIGAAAGAALALLLAPATGEETRRRLGETARKLGTEGKRRFDDLRDAAGDRMSEVKEAVKAGREAYRDARTTQREPSMGS
jgi:gas vesicle protein